MALDALTPSALHSLKGIYYTIYLDLVLRELHGLWSAKDEDKLNELFVDCIEAVCCSRS